MTAPAPSRRGVALLLVLAVLVLTVAALAPLAQLSSLVMRDRRDRAGAAAADDLVAACHTPILRWLNEHSARVVLEADAASPRCEVLNDRWQAGGLDVALSISAFDQRGMVPIGLIGKDRVLTFTLPDDLQDLRPTRATGLDELAGDNRRVFPSDENQGLATGELVATHNPWPPGTMSPAINVNTAPMPLVEAALRSAGRGGLDAIMSAREAGRPFALSSGPGEGKEAGVVPAGSSNSWAFRVRIVTGRTARLWWAVYVQQGSSWERVQLLAIPE